MTIIFSDYKLYDSLSIKILLEISYGTVLYDIYNKIILKMHIF